MRTSECINELAAALANAQGEFTSPERNREVRVLTKNGQEYRFWYSTLDCVMDMARPILAKHGLSITQPPTVRDGAVVVLTRLMHDSGQWQEEEISVTPESVGPQQIGSAVTYMKRYAYCGMLGIASDEDDDGNAASGNHVQESRTREPNPACPKCGTNAHVIKGKEEFGGGWVCYAKKGGCGAKWKDEPADEARAKAEKVAKQHGMTTADKLAAEEEGVLEGVIRKKLDSLDAAAPDAAERLTKAEDYIFEQFKAGKLTEQAKQRLDWHVAEIQREIDGHKQLDKEASQAVA